tara:strand:- start:11929 stop:12210 length:282 start_codon:yes stop_codon:yes gene_type:complete
MSSLNPIVGVSLCIGALGAGLAYLAWNNKEEENTNTEPDTEPDTEPLTEPLAEPENTNTEPDIEPETTGSTDTKSSQTKMQQFLKETYENKND